MPIKRSKGNMYRWVTHTHGHLCGKCSHACVYCYVQDMGHRFPDVGSKYSGPSRLIMEELAARYGKGRTIFVDHMSDLFAADVTDEQIAEVLRHCISWPDNTYVFQSKNPCRFKAHLKQFPPTTILGTTIETNRDGNGVSKAPIPRDRYRAMKWLRENTTHKLFVTVEPILAFDLDEFADWMRDLRPDFLNIGADSKGHGLAEPTQLEVLTFIERLRNLGIEVRQKENLERLIAA